MDIVGSDSEGAPHINYVSTTFRWQVGVYWQISVNAISAVGDDPGLVNCYYPLAPVEGIKFGFRRVCVKVFDKKPQSLQWTIDIKWWLLFHFDLYCIDCHQFYNLNISVVVWNPQKLQATPTITTNAGWPVCCLRDKIQGKKHLSNLNPKPNPTPKLKKNNNTFTLYFQNPRKSTILFKVTLCFNWSPVTMTPVDTSEGEEVWRRTWLNIM